VSDEEILLKPEFQNVYKSSTGNCFKPILMEELDGEPMCEIHSTFEKCEVANVRIVDAQELEELIKRYN